MGLGEVGGPPAGELSNVEKPRRCGATALRKRGVCCPLSREHAQRGPSPAVAELSPVPDRPGRAWPQADAEASWCLITNERIMKFAGLYGRNCSDSSKVSPFPHILSS